MISVSIIIPCKNEEKYIEKCIKSFLNQDYKGVIKIYVVDGLSNDNTINIIKSFGSKVNLIVNEKQTTPYALNLGLKKSKEDVKIIFGAHAVAYPDFVLKCVQTIQENEKAFCVGGIIEQVCNDSRSESISIAMSSSFGVGNAYFRTGQKKGYVDTVAFGAYKKEVFEKIGYFDENLTRNQDDEFNFRMTKHGLKIYLSPEIRSKYFVRSSFIKLYKQYFQYGFWKVIVNLKYSRVTSLRQLVPPVFVLFVLTAWIPGVWIVLAFYIYISIVGLYFITAVTTAFIKGKLRQIPTIILAFLCLHWSYGIGYLYALLLWPLKKNKLKNVQAINSSSR